MIKILDLIDTTPFLDFYFKIENEILWHDNLYKGKQTSIQYRLGEDPWLSSVGRSTKDEFEYSEINPVFQKSIFEEVIRKFNLKRTRLLWLGANACYSMHKDARPRIHIPLITNDQCFFIFRNNLVENLQIGNVYWVDTTKEHTAINGSNQWRLHLVGVVDQ